ncbi:MAG: hypothetical protein QME50_05215 [Candidatus Bathyarchaeota archaeon]|nr:hypothetical protein [Candidatus Bathyarchaeota archaeon]
MRKSLQLSLASVFAALHAVLYFISFGLWRNWGIYLESIEGIILGPKVGFIAALIGSSIARMIKPNEFWMFGIIAEPISVLMAGLLAKTRWKPVLGLYAITLSAYFMHPYGNPFGQGLPLWTILDVIFAFLLIYPAAKFGGNLFDMNFKRLPIKLVLISFACIATDSLLRVFLLIPCGLHRLFFPDFDALYLEFVRAAVDSYVEDLIVVLVSFVVGVPLLISALKLKFLENKNKV